MKRNSKQTFTVLFFCWRENSLEIILKIRSAFVVKINYSVITFMWNLFNFLSETNGWFVVISSKWISSGFKIFREIISVKFPLELFHFLFVSVDLDCETYFENSFPPFVFFKINFRFKWIVFLGQIFEVTFKTSIIELGKNNNLKT